MVEGKQGEKRRLFSIPPHLTGILLCVLGYFIVPVNDALAKHLSETYPILLIVWARYIFFMAPVAIGTLLVHGRKVLRPYRPGMQLVRGFLLILSTILFFGALRSLPMTDALAILFIAPFVVTVSAAILLKEPVGPKRWSAVVVGFVGALIVIRPGLDVIDEGTVLAFCAGITIGLYFTVTRLIAGESGGLISLFYSALPGTIGLSIALPLYWVPIDGGDWIKMMAMGLTAALPHYLFIIAYSRTNAATLAPFGYMEIVSNCLLGYLIFGDFPDSFTWIGIFVIISSGIYISVRERHVAS